MEGGEEGDKGANSTTSANSAYLSISSSQATYKVVLDWMEKQGSN